MNFLESVFGNILSTILRLVLVVGTMAAVYFFAIKPALETTAEISHTIDNATHSGDSIQQSVNHAIQQSQNQNQGTVQIPGIKGANGVSVQIGQAQQLLGCIQAASGDINKIQKCQSKFLK